MFEFSFSEVETLTSITIYWYFYIVMATSRKLLLVFTDSRGSNLDVYMDHQNILVKAFKGATLMQIINRAESTINALRPDRVLFIGGTCDLTILDRVTHTVTLRYDSFDQMLTHMLEVFKEARQQI